MPSPITTNDFTSLNYSGDICGRLSELLKVSEKLAEWFAYAFDANGDIGTEFLADLKSALTAEIGVPVGCMVFSPVSSVPAGYLVANGQAVNRTTYADLYERIGTTYGSGNGSTTFNLPDVRDKFLVGGNGSYSVASTGGESEVVLTEAQLPAHSHSFEYVIAENQRDDDGQGADPNCTIDPVHTAGREPNMSGTQTAGSGQGHNNLPPYLAGIWMIKY